MIYLLGAILCSTSITLGFALAGKRNYDTLNITMANYIVATLVCAAEFLAAWKGGTSTVSASGIRSIEPFGRSLPTFIIGIYTGVMYLLSFIFLQRSVLKCGPSAASLFSRISMILPVLISVFLFRETAGWLRWTGVAAALVGLVLYNYQEGLRIHPLLIGMFFFGGLADLSNKLFTRYCIAEEKPLFMMLVFGTAGLICLGMLIQRSRKAAAEERSGKCLHPAPKLQRGEVVYGIVIGVINMLSTAFSVSALQHLPATVVYPVLAVSTILLTSLAGRLFFGDRFSGRQKVAMVIVIAALIMLNV